MREQVKMTYGQWYERVLRVLNLGDRVYHEWAKAVAASADGVRVYDRWAL